MHVELWPVTKPVPYERNARKIPQSSIERVAASIKEFGWRQPIVVDGQGVIIAGHTRLLAAQSLGLAKVPVHVAKDFTPDQIKAYRLMDNRSHEGALWDVEMLGEELESLKALDFDLDLTGFEDFELDTLLGDDEPARLYQTEAVKLADLKDHPRNYRQHPPDQVEHIIKSIKQHGLFRNIVVAKDNTILAGHGLVAAYRKMGRKRVQVVRLDIAPGSIEALKVMVGDNDIADRGEVNDRTLTEMLKEIKDADELLGTGYDAMMLSNLLFVTRPASEIKDMDRAAEWAASGMPEYDAGEMPRKLVIAFRTDEDRVKFVEQTKLVVDTKREAWNWSTWWPERERDDLASVKFVKEPTA